MNFLELLTWGAFAVALGAPFLIIAAIVFSILALLCTNKYPRLSLAFWILMAICVIPVVVVFSMLE